MTKVGDHTQSGHQRDLRTAKGSSLVAVTLVSMELNWPWPIILPRFAKVTVAFANSFHLTFTSPQRCDQKKQWRHWNICPCGKVTKNNSEHLRVLKNKQARHLNWNKFQNSEFSFRTSKNWITTVSSHCLLTQVLVLTENGSTEFGILIATWLSLPWIDTTPWRNKSRIITEYVSNLAEVSSIPGWIEGTRQARLGESHFPVPLTTCHDDSPVVTQTNKS